MSKISEIQARLKSFSVEDISKKSIESTKDIIADKNRERMLEGRRADGSYLPNYSKVSVQVYGYPPGPIRLKNTGNFQKEVFVIVTPTSIFQDSKDSKSSLLKGKYGEAIFGLDKDGKKEYVTELRPVFVGNARRELKL